MSKSIPFPITPDEYHKRERSFDDARRLRLEAIHYQRNVQKMTQQEIADFWNVDISRINRLLKSPPQIVT